MSLFLYHKVHAPEGRIFNSVEDAPGDGWVDTPAKFDPNYVEPPPLVTAGTIPKDAAARGYVPQPYPSYRYNYKGESRVVASAAEDEELDPEVWKDSPAAFEAEPEGAVTPAEPLSDEDAAKAKALSEATIADLKDGLARATVADLRHLTKLRELEVAGKNRKTALEAIDARILELGQAPDTDE